MHRVQVLCKNGRVEGAIRMGRTWTIPRGPPKPIDGRIKICKEQIITRVMDMEELYCLSLPLADHPLKEAKDEVKKNYLIVLSTFVKRYSANNRWAIDALDEYAKHLLHQTFPIEIQNDEVLKGLVKKRALFGYRYNLICDILFLTAFGNAERLSEISNEVLGLFHQRHKNMIQHFIDILISNAYFRKKYRTANYLVDCWRMNADFANLPEKKIIVTATMSAGKSTLINTLIGVDLFETGNRASTDKIQFACNKPFDDRIVFQKGKTSAVFAKTFEFGRYRFIDTPGVNSGKHPEHQKITRAEILRGNFDVLLYVFNANQLDVNDDDTHLRFVIKKLPKKAQTLFILNKLDDNGKNDSINESLALLQKNLLSLGVKNPIICPVSMKAGRLAKKIANNEKLDKKDERQFNAFLEEFSSPQFDLTGYYTPPVQETNNLPILEKCGILGLERTLIEIGGKK